MSKKNTLIVSTLGVVIFLVSLFPEKFGVCKIVSTSCTFTFDQVAEIFFVFVPFFVFSLLTYKLREEIFHTWAKFAVVWTPLSMFLVVISPEYGGLFVPVEKGTVSFFSSTLFVAISLIVIIWKYFATRKLSK